MPKVLRILNRLIIGGPAINATYLSKYMSPDYETLLVIGGKDDHEQDADHLSAQLGLEPVIIPEMKRKIHPPSDRVAYRKLKQLIKDFQPDIVHTHAAKSGTLGRLAAAQLKVPVIVHTFHGHVFHSYFNKLKTQTFIEIERQLAKRSTGIIAISEQQKRELAEVYRICPEEKIKVIPLGLDLDLLQEESEVKRKAFRQQYRIEPHEIAIGIIGRIVPVKNHTLFVDAIHYLLTRTKQAVKVIIVGDGDMRPEMEHRFREWGIDYTYFPDEARVATAVCTSWRTDIDFVLAGLDIVALTSHNEGTPLSLIEAQAAGKAVVSTDVGGVKDVVIDKETGFICPPGHTKELGEALLKLVNDELLRSAMGSKGRTHARANFAYQRLVNDMSAYYQHLLHTRAPKR